MLWQVVRLRRFFVGVSFVVASVAMTGIAAPTPGLAQDTGQESLPGRLEDSAAVRRSSDQSDTASTGEIYDLPPISDDDAPYTGPAGGIYVPDSETQDLQPDVNDRRVIVSRDTSGQRGNRTRRRNGRGISGLFAGAPYIAGNISYVGAFELDIAGTGLPPAAGLSPTIDADLGFGFNVAGGWHFDRGFRAELEVSYFKAEFESLDNSTGSFDAEGDISGISGMVNFAYDMQLADRWFPHLGFGIGVSSIDSELTRIGTTAVALATDSDTVFSYQFILGLGFAVTPRLMVSSDYRYFATTDPDFGAYESELGVHKLSAGMRWKF